MTKTVFLETNALYSLGSRLENVDLAQLQELRDFLSFDIVVAETSWLEYLRHRRKELFDCLRRNDADRGTIEKHAHSIDAFDQVRKVIEDSLRSVDERYEARAREQAIMVVPTPDIDVRRLVKMSIAGDPPFEPIAAGAAREKGFRDATIMFTIMESIRGRQDDVVIVTGDGLLKMGIERMAAEYVTNPRIVPTIADAVKLITEELVRDNKQQLKDEAKEALDLLVRHGGEIAARVQEIKELTFEDLGQGGLAFPLSGLSHERLDIERVVEFRLGSITSAVWKDRDKPVSRILFEVVCDARVLARPYSSPFSALPSPIFVIGGEKKVSSSLSLNALGGPATIHRIPVWLFGDATFQRTESDWRLVSMKVEKSFSEEWLEGFTQLI